MKKTIIGRFFDLVFSSDPGTIFYIEYQSKDIQSYAVKAKKKVLTEECLLIEGKLDKEPSVKRLTKITVL